MDEILTVSTNNPLLHHVPLPEEMKESLPTVHPSSPKSSDTDVKFDISQSPHTEEEYTTYPSSETEEKFTTPPPQEGKAENTTITASETGVEFNTDPPSEIGIKCTTPLSHETEVEFVSQNAQFASKDIRYETVMKKLKQHTNEPMKVVKKKV